MGSEYHVAVLSDKQVHQGDVIRNLPFYERYIENEGRFELSVLEVPYSIVLTQECDLENYTREGAENKKAKKPGDTFRDKYLVSLLCAPLYNAEHLFQGTQLSEISIESESKNSNQRNYIKQNRDPRYHYIEFCPEAKLVPMVVDFKHYFSVSISILEQDLSQRTCSLMPLYRELISQRFSNFLSRIGLP